MLFAIAIFFVVICFGLPPQRPRGRETCQVVIIENPNPPDDVQQCPSTTHFTKRASRSRYGLYPTT